MTVVQIRDAIGSRMAYDYLKRKIALTKIHPHSKKPVEKDWTTKFYTNVEAASIFTDYNLGIILGRSSQNLTDIDLDCPEAVKLAPRILPGTNWVFGRKSAPRSHYMYTVKDSKTTKYASPMKDGGMLLEIRSDGAQTVGPGSIHPSGESINFYDEAWKQFPPRDVPATELYQRVGDLAAAVLVLRHGWASGKRDELAVALCGLMLRMKRDPDYVDEWLGAIADAAGDEELDMRLKAEYQQKRLEKNEKVPGIPSLMNILGPDIGTRVIDWMGVRSLNMVHEFNQEIGLINMGGRARILVDGGYWSGGVPQFVKLPDARAMFQGRGEILEGKKKVLKFDVWMKAEERRNYNSLVFAPDGCKETEYNLWKGWPIAEQDNAEGCECFLNHVKEVICSGDQKLYDYVITWLADSIQNITNRPGVALVLQGAQGTGKTMFADYVLAMYGKYGITSTNSEYLFGKHNSHLMNKLMVFADESCWAGNRHHAAVLNNMITSNTMGYEPKGVDLINMDNFLRLMMATNDDWAVPANGAARRFCIIQVSDSRYGDGEYFERLAFEMQNDGPECLLGYLKRYKITRNLRKLPDTGAITKNKILSIMHNSPVLGWWIQRLIAEAPVKGGGVGWEDFISLDQLYRDYFQFSGNNRNDRGNQVSFGMSFRNVVPEGTRIVKKRINGVLKRGYRLPPIEKCKEFVAEHLIKEPTLFSREWGI